MRLAGALAAAAIAAGCAGGASAGEDELRSYLEEEAARGFSGAVLVLNEGRRLVDQGYGLADRERRIPIQRDTVFELGSITKVFTAATVMRLAEEGRLRLDDRLPRFFRDVPRSKRSITVRQLLAHRSGLPEYPGYGDLVWISRGRSMRNALDLPLRFRPGTRTAYSNVGYTVLAAIVEVASGERFERAMRRRVFAPAGMSQTGFFGERLWPPERVAIGYEGLSVGARNAPDARRGVSWSFKGAGGVVGPTGDLERWAAAVWAGRIIRRASVPLLYRLAVGPPPPGRRPYAYAGGNAFGFNATVAELPDDQALVVVLSNSSPPGAARAEVIERRLVDLLRT